MKFTLLLSCSFFLTSTFAAPRGSGLNERVHRRAVRSHLTSPLQLIDSEVKSDVIELVNATHVQYSSNWAGAVLEAPPAGSTFTAVSGQFTVPTPSFPSGSSKGSYSASVWVGIDGDTYQNSILQAGIDVTITKSGSSSSITYDSWYEWYPNYATDFSTSSFSFTAGDVISLSITSSSSSKGVVTLNNLTTGKTVSKNLTSPSTSANLGGQNAEWIVEDFEQGGALVPFANFGTVKFTSSQAKTSAGTVVGTDGAAIIEIKSGSKVLTTVSVPSSSEVLLVYNA